MMTAMAWDRTTLPGRAAELSELDSALAGATASRHILVAVRGAGRTALLATATGRWRRRGITVLTPQFGDAAPWDAFGAGPVLDAIRTHYTWSGDFSLAGPVDAAAALCTADAYQPEPLLARLAELFDRVPTACPTVLVADDLDTVAEPASLLAAACRPGYLVVAACADTELAPDHVIDLGPPGEHAQESSFSPRNLKIS